MILGGKLIDWDYSARSGASSDVIPAAHKFDSSIVENPADSETALFASTAPAPARTLVDIITTTMEVYPSALALDDGTCALSYAQLRVETEELAKRLWAMDIGAGDRVGVRVPSGSKNLYVAILGTLFAGAAYVPVDADEPEDRATTVWEEAGVCVVIGENLAITHRAGVRTQGNSPFPTPVDDAWIIFTSGSTGKPKGVAITHRSAAAWADAEAEMFLQDAPLTRGDRVLAGLSVAFDASCEEMWLAWRHGACLVPAPRDIVRSGADLGDWLGERKVTVVSTVPTLAALWPAETLENIRLLIFGGEALPPELVERLAGPTREVWNTYGPTEATVIACGAPVAGGGPVSIGLPLRGWDLAVVDAEGFPVPWGSEGELIIGGVGLGRYLDPQKDAQKFAPMPTLGWERAYRSGDMVRAERDGLLFVGRADEQVKLGGRRVELGEIDEALAALPGVAQAAAAVQSTPSGNKVLAGYLVPDAGAALDLAACRSRLAEFLPAQLVPALGQVAELPLKTSGKVDRKGLPWPLHGATEEPIGHRLTGTEGWVAEIWTELLGPVALDADSDFFAAGGASVAAAQLVGVLRTRHRQASIADIYNRPTLGALAAHLDAQGTTEATVREQRPTGWWIGLVQAPVIGALYSIIGLRYVTGMALVCWILFNFMDASWVPNPPLIPLLAAWVVLYTLPFRVLLVVVSARLLLAGVHAGAYRRGGGVHLRLWAVERIVTFAKVEALMGTPLAPWYARALGNKIGKNVHLDAMPPVTGLARIGSDTAIEYEVDLAGHWLDGDTLRIGQIDIGQRVRIGTRSTINPGARIGNGAEIEAGSSVDGTVGPNELVSGSPLEYAGVAGDSWPQAEPRAPRHGFRVGLGGLYALGLGYLALLPMLSVLPGGLLLFSLIDGGSALGEVLWQLAAWAPVFIVLMVLSFAGLTALSVRLLARLLTPGFHSAHGLTAWACWLSNLLLAKSLMSLYPIYASIITPLWLRMLGAKVGAHTEISTLETIPHLTTLGDRCFMADHSLASHRRVRGQWLQLGQATVGAKSFVGNSAIVGPDTVVPADSLIAVLSSAPQDMPVASNWFGRPAMELPRPIDNAESALTYNPSRGLMAARALVELCRILPMLITSWLALGTVWILSEIFDRSGLALTLLLSGPVLLGSASIAALTALIAKWALVGRFRAEEHPLWTSFIWRNELADVFSESLAVAGVVRMSLGTPMLNLWFRLLGARIGRRVWCETWWLPEQDLISIGDGASINRGTVLQTHLFHDRIMRLEEVHLGAQATLAPNGVILPGSRIGDAAAIGPCSLVMRSEQVPANGRWRGNPIRSWS
ncbi:amino acid adenylation protein [Arthrobacter sp. MYb229]|uniref:Pls/PosA family non-ribosomal peptide synthetase n=1 Tax=unclassified Arthrobacter TaxID=235627 RepID=UPI000CFDDC36|nr:MULTISPECIES: Pls/PosA family non-ribosomal peptide synthetase [unclassified Arthrobacter]PRA04025.1 amino acid adenylation protein [Arthrobacter sp. MYb229]PRB52063.1 amino acid adenylation protein [Arthrobacter sp. MYb216]